MKSHFLILVGLVAGLALFAAGPSCSPDQLQRADRIIADVNTAGRGVAAIPDGPAGALIPPEVRLIMELLGVGAAVAFGLWQRVRASGLLETKQGLDVTLRAIVDAIDQAEPTAADPVKTQILANMLQRRIHGTADRLVDEHRTKLAT